MENISVHLQQFVVESLHPKTLAGRQISINEFDKWQYYIRREIGKLSDETFSVAFQKGSRKVDYVKELFQVLTELSNTVNGYLMRYSKLWREHAMAQEIRLNYLLTCNLLENFLDKLYKKYPEVVGSQPYSDFMVFEIKSTLKSQLKALKFRLTVQEISPDLVVVIVTGIEHLINRRLINRDITAYLKKLVNSLMTKPWPNSDQLVDHLISNDFNLPEFFLFCVDGWARRLTTLDGLHEQREMLLNSKSHLFDLSLSNGYKFPGHKERLYNELNGFLSEKYAIVKERIKISRQLAYGQDQNPKAKRTLINLSVAQFGLFIRMQIEKGLLAKENVGELFAFFARHFYTPNTDFISAESLQKKSSDVEHATARKMKSYLISMLNWLNTNYNLSNYN